MGGGTPAAVYFITPLELRRLSGGFASELFPPAWSQLLYLVVSHGRKPRQHILQIFERLDSVHATVGDQGVDDRIALAGLLCSEEQEIFLFLESSPEKELWQLRCYGEFPDSQVSF